MEKQKRVPTVDLFLMIGIGLTSAYFIVSGLFGSMPDLLAYLWMISAGICTLIGIFRTIKRFRR